MRVRDLPEAVQEAAPDAGGPSSKPSSSTDSLTIRLDEPLDRILERVIRAALSIENGNRARAAERLGVSVRTIQRHIAREGVDNPP